MLIASVQLGAIYKLQPARGRKSQERDVSILATSDDHRRAYQQRIEECIILEDIADDTEAEAAAETRYEKLKTAIRTAAEDTLPRAPKRINGRVKYMDDEILKELSERQRRLTGRIYRRDKCRNERKRKTLHRKRNKIFTEIRQRQRELEKQKLERLAAGLEQSSGTRAAFEFARVMQKNTAQKLTLLDAEGNEIRHTTMKLKLITEFYEDFFTRKKDTELQQWRGPARALTTKITTEEVAIATARLNNHRAKGPDGLAGELLKYGGQAIHREYAEVLNQIFERHETIQELKEGHLIPLNKPKKPCIASNTRPLILLAASRKALSTIVLLRIQERVGNFLSPGQHAYRSGRSATEVIWTIQWIRATVEQYAERVRTMGIDLSKAFDCLDRTKLIEIIEEHGLATEDELRLITFLLSETTMRIKVDGILGISFKTIIGTPQGDALSPILFLIYLEHILRTYPQKSLLHTTDMVMAYADDVTMALRDTAADTAARAEQGEHQPRIDCECTDCRTRQIQETLHPHFATFEMTMNPDKTVHGEISTRKFTMGVILGSEVDGTNELATRKRKAAAAFNALRKLWIRGIPVSIETKMKIYNGTVLPHFLQSSGAMVLKKTELDKLEAAHRSQLRRLIGIFYPEHITTEELYKRTGARPLSIDITRARWSLIGHILRLAEKTPEIPAYQAMLQHFKRRRQQGEAPRTKTRRGRVLTTIQRIMQLDLQKITPIKHRKHLFGTDDLNTGTNIQLLKIKAQNRTLWTNAVEALVKADAEAWTKRNRHASEKRKEFASRQLSRGGRGNAGGRIARTGN